MKKQQTTRKSLWTVLLALFFMAALPLKAEITFVDETYNYMVMLQGSNRISFNMPVYDMEGADCWVEDGRLYYQVEGSDEKFFLFEWWAGNRENGVCTVLTAIRTRAEGTVTVWPIAPGHNQEGEGRLDLPKNLLHNVNIYGGSKDAEHYMINGSWVIPMELRGKTLTFTWYVMRNGNARSEDVVTIKPTIVNIPDASPAIDPFISEPFLDPDSVGCLALPWMMATDAKKVEKVEAEYLDRDGTLRIMPLKAGSNGNVYLRANEIYRKLRIKADYIDSDGYRITGRTSDTIDVPMMHGPVNLKVSEAKDGKGSMLLEWDINDPDYPEYLEMDGFVIQRSVTGDEDDDYVDIGTVLLDVPTEHYSFKDSTLISSFTKIDGAFLNDTPHVKYRVSRATPASLWGFKGNPLVQADSIKLKKLQLLLPENATADWDDKDEHIIKVTWDYAQDDDATTYLWDNRAEMKFRIHMERRDGSRLDDMEFSLTNDEIQKRIKKITLPRPCVKYMIDFVVQQEDSPVRSVTIVPIGNEEDWNKFVTLVNNGVKNIKAYLTNDINVRLEEATGNTAVRGAFQGVFDGRGHNIHLENVNFLFSDVFYSTIKNLRISGSAATDRNVGAERGSLIHRAENTVIENCFTTVSYAFIKTMMAGFVHTAYDVDIRNCVFAGGMGSGTNSGFVGITDTDTPARLFKCVTAPSMGQTAIRNYTLGKDVVFDSCFYKGGNYDVFQGERLSSYDDEALAQLGAGWIIIDDIPGVMPVMSDNDPINEESVIIVDHRDFNLFYYENTGKIDKEMKVESRQSSVYLTWDTDGGVIDRFVVQRRVVGEEKWETLIDDLTGLSYEDTSVKPLVWYEYKVLSAVDCEGTHYEETNVYVSGCKDTGMLEGYIRFKDGTGVPGIDVEVVAQDDKNVKKVVTTDADGHYVVDELPYIDRKPTTYDVAPVSGQPITIEPTGFAVTFDSETNYRQAGDITVTSGYRFSGYVMYDNTNIPVEGARFMVNNYEVRNSSGRPVQTDHQGKFTFYVNNGDNVIQAFKDGHKFYNQGYYKSAKGYNFTKDVDQIYFYDETKVHLIGRLAGGDDQGKLPLGNNLSRNNLGENLKMVLTLEGDNSSWLYYDNLNPDKTTHDTTYVHALNDGGNTYQTKVHTTRKRIEVTPDVHTGEYSILLPPVRWKVQQAYCEGYPTLFAPGKVSEVIDLTDSITPHTDTYEGTWKTYGGHELHNITVSYDAIYNCIYHAPIEVDYHQMSYDDFTYFGDRYYSFANVDGTKEKIALAYKTEVPSTTPNDTVKHYRTDYTFGYPVFSVERKYQFRVSAVERYYWNNHHNTDTIDVVKLSGGKVIVHNGMVSTTHKEEVELDEKGDGYVYLRAESLPYSLKEAQALRTVSWTLEMDGVTYEAKPLQAYVLNIYERPGANDIMTMSHPVLFDILRDPPGGSSTATLSKGASLTYSYQMDMSFKGGLNLTLSRGTKLDNYYGTVAAPGGTGGTAGITQGGSQTFNVSHDLAISGGGTRAFTYTLQTTEDITTSSSATMVGGDGDVYIGLEELAFVRTANTIRAIPDSIFQQMGGVLATGRAVEIAKGTGENGKVYHLVRDESLTYGNRVKSTFHHSQKYIVKQLIPSFVKRCKELMFTGTLQEAKTLADQKGEPVYLALVPASSSDFGTINLKNDEVYYYTDRMPDEDGMNYRIVLPSSYTDSDHPTDSIQQIYSDMLVWTEMIAGNEREKLTASELVRNISFDGGTTISYSENFTSNYSIKENILYPWGGDEFGKGEEVLNNAVLTFGPEVVNALLKLVGKNKASSGSVTGTKENTEDPDFTIQMAFQGNKLELGWKMVASYNNKPSWSQTEAYNRKESFKLSIANKCHLDIDVYCVKPVRPDGVQMNVTDVFTGENFFDNVDHDEEYLKRHMKMENLHFARSFVYRTRGGATAKPWEDARKTIFYQPGSIIDERTKKVQNPGISMDKQSVSGVPVTEPARFYLYLTNDSEEPTASSGGLSFFTLYQDEMSNPHGAKLMVDGAPLTGTGRTVQVNPGEVTQKLLEVYAGDEFDYEGLKISLRAVDDYEDIKTVAFDVHYKREAGGIDIASPGDKWLMNTDAAYDEKRGYYLPVTITGFNVNQPNFDHIEFQYKESARGDEYWTNLCSYYADSTLMAKASGTKAMIAENGDIVTKFYGDEVVIEKAYDLRAVLYVRNGNSFITSSSKVLSGIKDTRRPTLFGVPEPRDGILDDGENIVFNFSEDIEYNYLKETAHFEVKGELNSDNVTEDVALYFDGNSGIETEATRNFNGKSLTLDMKIKPDSTGRDMPLFSHGTDGKKLQLWYTADKRLKAVVGTKQYTSKEKVESQGFSHVAMVIRQPEKTADPCTLELYKSGERLDSFQLDEAYTGSGPLVLGSTNETVKAKRKKYQGRMMEVRLWYRALTGQLIGSTYGNTRLSGYEMGLVDYYPMNEGYGNYALDKAQGANILLEKGVAWAMPQGMSLHLEFADKGIALNQNAINRTTEQDYTLMFWFKTSQKGRGALLSNGWGKAEDKGAKNQFFIGFEADDLKYRSNGREILVPGYFCDDAWHHYAMTVNRAMNVCNIYVDHVLRSSFEVDTLGGISGGYPMIGGCYYTRTVDGKDVVLDSKNYLAGNIDDLCLFEQALPTTLIRTIATRSPEGDEAGLVTYLSFERQERQKDNSIMYVPYVYSKKIYKDENGNVIYQKDPETQLPTTTPRRDFPFDSSVTKEDVLSHIDQGLGAPVRPYIELHNLNFSFVGRDNQLLININNSDEKINKRNLYVTVREIPDKNGNTLASAATALYFVDRNALRWNERTLRRTLTYGEGDTFEVMIENKSQAMHTYEISNYPKWLTVTPAANTIDPTEQQIITFTVNKHLNVGQYDEIIYLTDENGLAEPLSLSVIVEGVAPDWTVSRDLRQYSMGVTARVLLNEEIDADGRDIVGAFDINNVCHGVANITKDEITGESMLYITVYDSIATDTGKEIFFKLWRYTTGREMLLTAWEPDQSKIMSVTFSPSRVYGSSNKPIVLKGGSEFVQTIHLEKGWNWVSFSVATERFSNINRLLNAFPWQNGDIITDNNSGATMVYVDNQWNISDYKKELVLSPEISYCVKVQKDIDVQIAGFLLKDKIDRTIHVGNGWNSIGYTPIINLTVETALTDYYDKAKDGDMIKSHDEFAIFTEEATGRGRWKGNLQYMKPGEGYMLLRQDNSETSFVYPFYEPGSTFIDEAVLAPEMKAVETGMSTTMTLSATATGIDMLPGDRLLAYADGELRGAGTLSADSLFYVSISGDKRQPLWFAIEREGEIVATTMEVMTYEANAVVGQPAKPASIDFARRETVSHGWYTLDGIKLNHRPTKKGVYIYNGKKHVVE